MTRRRGLSHEERELWSRYARTAEALPGARRDAAPPEQSPAPPKKAIAQPVRPFSLGERAKADPPRHALAPSLREEMAGHPLRMDAKAHKRMTSGKLRPEGKLDLHGMTTDRAHPALQRFVLGAHADGRRLLLVVTGKGKSKPSEGPIPNRLGVLKHQVPQWLRMPPLSSVVLQVSEAHRSHGGSGAYYVYLRRAR